MTTRKNRKGEQGFTLVELLVVVAIISLLAVIAVPKLMSTLDTSRSARNSADLAAVTSALDKFYFDNGFYPVYLNTLIKTGYLKQNNFTNAYGNSYFYAVDSAATPEVWNSTQRAFTTVGSPKTYALADPGKQPLALTNGVCSMTKANVDQGALGSVCQGLGPTVTPFVMGTGGNVTTDTAGYPDSNGSLRGFSNKIFTE